MSVATTTKGRTYKGDPGTVRVETHLAEWRDEGRDRTVACALHIPHPDDLSGPVPLVAFAHGFGESRLTYAHLGRHWGSHGYTVVVANHHGSDIDALRDRSLIDNVGSVTDRPLDLTFVIDRLLDGAHPRLAGRIDPDRIGACGHSLGTTTALQLVGLTVNLPDRKQASYRDERVRAAISFSNQVGSIFNTDDEALSTIGINGRSWDPIDRPVMFMTGTHDWGMVEPLRSNPGLRKIAFERTRSTDRYWVDIETAEHHAFTDTAPFYARNYASGERDPRHGWWIDQLSTAFWDAYLRGDPDARAWLEDGAITDLSGGEVVFERPA